MPLDRQSKSFMIGSNRFFWHITLDYKYTNEKYATRCFPDSLARELLLLGCPDWIYICQLGASQGHLRRENLNWRTTPIRLVCRQVWRLVIDVGGPRSLWPVPPLVMWYKKTGWAIVSVLPWPVLQFLPPGSTLFQLVSWFPSMMGCVSQEIFSSPKLPSAMLIYHSPRKRAKAPALRVKEYTLSLNSILLSWDISWCLCEVDGGHTLCIMGYTVSTAHIQSTGVLGHYMSQKSEEWKCFLPNTDWGPYSKHHMFRSHRMSVFMWRSRNNWKRMSHRCLTAAGKQGGVGIRVAMGWGVEALFVTAVWICSSKRVTVIIYFLGKNQYRENA